MLRFIVKIRPYRKKNLKITDNYIQMMGKIKFTPILRSKTDFRFLIADS